MKKKQIMAMVMAAAMTATIGAGSAMTAGAEERTTVTWYAVGGNCDSQDRISELGTKLLNDAGIDVNFEIKWLGWDTYDNTISNMIVTGEEFDIFNRDISTINNYALNGGIYEITEEDLETYLPEVVANMGEDLIDSCRYGSALYATPVAHEFAQWRGVLYNKAIADEYGIDMSSVKSIDDLDAVFAKLKEEAPDIYALDPLGSEDILMVMADLDVVNRAGSLALGMDLTDEVDGVYNIYSNEKVVSAFKKLKEWNEAGYIFDDTTADNISLFRSEGKIFCQICRMKPGTAEQYSTSSVTLDKVLFDEQSIRTFCDFPGGWGNGISATSDNPQAAMQVLNFAYSNQEFIDLLIFGEEGVDYTKDADGIVTVNDSGYGAQVYANASWQMGNHYINSVTSAQVASGLSELGSVMKEFNDAAVSTKHTGFYFNALDYSGEVSAIANTCSEYTTSLYLGEVDVDETLAEFNEALEANGIQTLVDAANEQYQEFLAEKAE